MARVVIIFINVTFAKTHIFLKQNFGEKYVFLSCLITYRINNREKSHNTYFGKLLKV